MITNFHVIPIKIPNILLLKLYIQCIVFIPNYLLVNLNEKNNLTQKVFLRKIFTSM